MKDCCYKSVFGGISKRKGRCNYECPFCGGDVSMLWAFYMLSKQEQKEEEKNIKHNLSILKEMGITPPHKGN